VRFRRIHCFEDIDRLKLTIFQQDWWLKVAKGSARLKEVRSYGANGAVIGRLRAGSFCKSWKSRKWLKTMNPDFVRT
jgi:hypothetical protein